MPKRTRPRKGTLQFSPRKRARRIYPGMKENIGFAAFKAGMTHVQYIDNNSKSPSYGKLIVKAATILDAPSLFVLGVRFYKKTTFGLKCVGEKWAEKIPKEIELERKTTSGKGKVVSDADETRIIVATQPKKSSVRKKKPDIFEMESDSSSDKLNLIGKEISASEIFKPGEYVDVSAVTKGHGFTGPVKRFGIRIQTRKDQQMHRHVGSIGGVVPRRVDWRVPSPGQHGFHKRTEYSKKILAIDSDGSKVNAKGGLVGYGFVNNFILIEGSVPGSKKRLVMVRKSQRPKPLIQTELKEISLESKQGV
jgi:large subunit ribosomal protein L3